MFANFDMHTIAAWLAQQSTPQRIEVIAEQHAFSLAYTVELVTLLQLRGDVLQIGDGYAANPDNTR